jgi:hypothetical protein
LLTLTVHPYFAAVRELGLPKADFAIFGSGPLIVRGLIEGSNDLDVLCRGDAWKTVETLGRVSYLEEYDVTVASICDGRVTFGTEWGIGNPDVNALIDAAELIEGLPFVRLCHVVRYKLQRASAKDMQHIELLKKNGFGHLLAESGG